MADLRVQDGLTGYQAKPAAGRGARFIYNAPPMANSAQARKRARQADSRRAANMALASRYRTFVKNVSKLIEQGEREQALKAYREAASVIDSAVSRKLIHRNKAARQKSRLNARIKSLGA